MHIVKLDKQMAAWHKARPIVEGWRRFPASGSLPPRLFSRPSLRARNSSQAVSSRHGWDWCPTRIRAAVKSDWARSRSKGTCISASSWFSGLPHSYGTVTSNGHRVANGSATWFNASPHGLRPCA